MEETNLESTSALPSEKPLTNEQLEKVSGGSEVEKQKTTSNEPESEPISANRIHQRRLELIDNPELAQ